MTQNVRRVSEVKSKGLVGEGVVGIREGSADGNIGLSLGSSLRGALGA